MPRFPPPPHFPKDPRVSRLWRLAVGIAVVVLLIVLVLLARIAYASSRGLEGAHSETGIPVEWLFGAIGALVGAIYWDMRRQLRELIERATRREQRLTLLHLLVTQVCHKLDIAVPPEDDS
jgi:hypothetical protein